jgi:Ni,Fe-hydrogenase III small subunit
MLRLLLDTLTRGPRTIDAPVPDAASIAELAARVSAVGRARLGRSLAIREVDAGSCNGCELEIHALNNPVYDLERFGIRFVASPRHADVLLVTGPVTTNMRSALLDTWRAVPGPKWLVAAGDCAAGTGVFAGGHGVCGSGAVSDLLPVDLHVRGCPPRPIDLLSGLLALLQVAERATVSDAG